MKKRFVFALLTFAAAAVPACSEDVEPVVDSEALLPCDVSQLLQQRCQNCHGVNTQFGAPMSLVTHADLLAAAVTGSGSVAERSVTRMQATTERMPPPPNVVASAAEVAVLQGWIDAGMPARAAGETCDGGSGGAGGGGGGGDLGCVPSIALTAQHPYNMPADKTDSQICFGIDVPASVAKRHITAIVPRLDNKKIIHHILLMQAPSSVPAAPAPCDFTQSDWKLLYAWGPGAPPQKLPPEAGFPIEGGETIHFVMQVHYNNLQGLVGEQDQSGIDLCTTETLRPHDADIMAFGGGEFSLTPAATTEMTCDLTVPAVVSSYFPVTIFQSWPHMHQLGRAMHSELRRPDNSVEVLVDVPDYSFDYQTTYPNNGIKLGVGDVVRTSCSWHNTTNNTVTFGENTADEMCFNFVTYYPRINSTQWTWLAPASPSPYLQCSSQLK